jgi:hypothetical protein
MKTYKKVTYETEIVIVDTVKCNMCAKDVTFDIQDGINIDVPQHAVTLKVIGEYRHHVLPDMSVLWVDLCEVCLGNIFSQLQIKPTKGDDFSWIRPENEAKEEDNSLVVE